jgi:hypothetical protein
MLHQKDNVPGRNRFLKHKENRSKFIPNSKDGKKQDQNKGSISDVAVGAAAVTAIQDETNYEDELVSEDVSLSQIQSTQDPAIVTIANARLVEDITVDAIPIEESQVGNDNVKNSKKGSIRRYMLVTILFLVVIIAIVIAVVFFIKKKSPTFQCMDLEKK